MFKRWPLLAAVLFPASFAAIAAGAVDKPFPGYSWRSFQDGQGLAGPGYTHYGAAGGRALRPPFERALAGEPSAVDAFFDLKLQTDGEHSFIHQRMTLLLLDSLGDRAFCRQLSRRAPMVQWAVSQGLCWEAENPAFSPVFRSRFPRTLSLARRWNRISACAAGLGEGSASHRRHGARYHVEAPQMIITRRVTTR